MMSVETEPTRNPQPCMGCHVFSDCAGLTGDSTGKFSLLSLSHMLCPWLSSVLQHTVRVSARPAPVIHTASLLAIWPVIQTKGKTSSGVDTRIVGHTDLWDKFVPILLMIRD